MGNFRIVPLSKEYARRIRKELRDDFGHEVVEQFATGYGPCRVSLKPFRPGIDKRLLFSHSPFNIDNAFNQPGPVFIHADDVDEYSEVDRFPRQLKADNKNFPLTLIGYNRVQQMTYSRMVGDDDVDELIEHIFEGHADVEYLHARNAEAGCFICKIERLPVSSVE
jgi:hypothetical protein